MNIETTEQDLNEMLDDMAGQVASGVLLSTIRARFENSGASGELVDKCVRIVEIRAAELMENTPR